MVVTYPVDIPSGCPFSIQNIPFGIFSTQPGRGRGVSNKWHTIAYMAFTADSDSQQLQRRAGVAVGQHVLDLHVLVENGIFAEATWSRPLENIFLAVSHLFVITGASAEEPERVRVRESSGRW